MKYNKGLPKTLNLVFSLMLIAGVSAPRLAADLSSFDQSPYTYGPEGRTIQDLQNFQRPSAMMNIVPFRPVMTRDKYGVRQFWSTAGKPLLTINADGSMAFQLNGTTINKAPDGSVATRTKIQHNSNVAVITDGEGNYLGYQTIAFGYNVQQQFDSNNNLTQTYHYSHYAKKVDYIINELTQTRTVFDSNGLPTTDINYEGSVVASYIYDDHSRLMHKTDNRMNKTYYSLSTGQMDRTEDRYGNILVQYYYKTNHLGMDVLETSVDNIGLTTFYSNGKPRIEKDAQGNTTKEYGYNGQTLVFTFDNFMAQTTWYDVNGNPLFISKDDVPIQEWLYSKGRLVGVWDYARNVLTGYIRGDAVSTFLFIQKPNAQFVQQMIDEGIIKKNYSQ
jgi:hypothetical protein